MNFLKSASEQTNKPTSKLIAIDPSLTSSGWVVFDLNSERPLATGCIKAGPPSIPLASRLKEFQGEVEVMFSEQSLNLGDYLISEGPAPLVKNPDSATKVEQVRGIFETIARSSGLRVPGRINPRSIQSELLGLRGAQKNRDFVKDSARKVVSSLMGSKLAELEGVAFEQVSQDIVDAALIGVYAISRVKRAQASGFTVEELLQPKKPSARGSSARRGSGNRWSESDFKKRV